MDDNALREHVLYLLDGGGAHLDFEKAIADLPVDLRGARAPGIPHTPWRLVEHMRICQWDIVRFTVDPDHISPLFPEGYWPEGDAPPSTQAWDETIDRLRRDLETVRHLVRDTSNDLFARIPHGEGQTLLREALLVADHNAYHLGQLVVLRRALGAWAES